MAEKSGKLGVLIFFIGIIAMIIGGESGHKIGLNLWTLGAFFFFLSIPLSLVDKLLGIKSDDDRAVSDKRPTRHLVDVKGTYNFPIVGESHYQGNLRKLARKLSNGDASNQTVWARLVHDPKNKFDSDAIAVLIKDMVVGHIPRDRTAELLPLISTSPGTCPAIINGGHELETGKRAYLGVVLSVKTPPEFENYESAMNA